MLNCDGCGNKKSGVCTLGVAGKSFCTQNGYMMHTENVSADDIDVPDEVPYEASTEIKLSFDYPLGSKVITEYLDMKHADEDQGVFDPNQEDEEVIDPGDEEVPEEGASEQSDGEIPTPSSPESPTKTNYKGMQVENEELEKRPKAPEEGFNGLKKDAATAKDTCDGCKNNTMLGCFLNKFFDCTQNKFYLWEEYLVPVEIVAYQPIEEMNGSGKFADVDEDYIDALLED